MAPACMMFSMVNGEGSGLAEIRAGVTSGEPLSQLLTRVVMLARQAGSEDLQSWASRELHGYVGQDTVPDYRHIAAVVMLALTDGAGRSAGRQQFSLSVFPLQVRDMIRERLDVGDAYLSQGVGEIEAMAAAGMAEHDLVPYWSPVIVQPLNQHLVIPGIRVDHVFWAVPNVAVQGVLSRIRATLAELVAELTALMPAGQEAPDKAIVDQAAQIVITGNRATISFTSLQAGDGGTNVIVAGADAAGPVIVAGAEGSATGSQIASGENATVTGSQAVSGAGSVVVGGQAVQLGRDASVAAGEQSVKEGWWARLRKRGVIATVAIIITGIGTVFIWIGWKPW